MEERISPFLRKPGTVRLFEELATMHVSDATPGNKRRSRPQR
jgi:hypothetical protein